MLNQNIEGARLTMCGLLGSVETHRAPRKRSTLAETSSAHLRAGRHSAIVFIVDGDMQEQKRPNVEELRDRTGSVSYRTFTNDESSQSSLRSQLLHARGPKLPRSRKTSRTRTSLICQISEDPRLLAACGFPNVVERKTGVGTSSPPPEDLSGQTRSGVGVISLRELLRPVVVCAAHHPSSRDAGSGPGRRSAAPIRR